MSNHIRIGDDANAWASWLENITRHTANIYLCKDGELIDKRNDLLDEIEIVGVGDSVENTAFSESSLVTVAAANVTARKAELEEELKAVEEKIRAASVVLETQSPTEDELASLGNLFEENPDEWILKILHFATGRSVDEVKLLRSKLDRASWNFVFTQVLNEHIQRSSGVDFLSKN